MRLPRSFNVISLFGRGEGHFLVPAKFQAAVARSGGPGRRKAPARMRLALDGREPGGSLVPRGTDARRWRGGCGLAALLLLNPGVVDAQPWPPSSPPPQAAVRLDLRARIDAAVAEAALRFDLPEAWVRAVMRAESAVDPRAVSRGGAMGLMQLMPATWAELRARFGLGSDPFDVRDNILAGAAYLRDLLDRFGVGGFLAAYNAGPGRYADHLATGRPLPAETRAYVAIVASNIGLRIDAAPARTWRIAAVDWTRSPLFAGGPMPPLDTKPTVAARRNGARSPIPTSPQETPADPLFAVRRGSQVWP